MPTDLINDPVDKALEMMKNRTDAAVDKLRTRRRKSALRKALPDDMTMKSFMEILERTNG